jgi:CheY-like chemotaxis protein
VSAASGVAILVVDDNAAKRLALRAALEPLGHAIVEADSGLAALHCVMAQDFAVILLDVRMPIMDGFETAEVVRRRQQSELTPIIFVTAYRSDEIKNADLSIPGPVDFVFAPFAPDELRRKVSACADRFMLEALAERDGDPGNTVEQVR